MKNIPDIIKYEDDAVFAMRKEFNLHIDEDREQAIELLQEWVRQQQHFIKKEYSKPYLEKCLSTSKGSLERAKLQIDKLCTFRTLMPHYFRDVEEMKMDIMSQLRIGYIGFLPQLTQDYYRVLLIKIKPDVNVIPSNCSLFFFQTLVICAEFLKSNDYHNGVLLIVDSFDKGLAEVLFKINFIEFQQFMPILTEGYGARIKGIIIGTPSKLIQSFIKMVKPFFSEKIGSRFHVASSRQQLQDFILPVEILPQEYGGKEVSVPELTDNLITYLTSDTHQSLMREMNAAKTDETKRRKDKFNEQYMGMPGTFRTLSVD